MFCFRRRGYPAFPLLEQGRKSYFLLVARRGYPTFSLWQGGVTLLSPCGKEGLPYFLLDEKVAKNQG